MRRGVNLKPLKDSEAQTHKYHLSKSNLTQNNKMIILQFSCFYEIIFSQFAEMAAVCP